MSMFKIAVPMVLAAGVLSGCSTFQEGNVPVCAAIGGVVGGGLGAIEDSTMAGVVGATGAVVAAAYCWVHGDADGDGVVNKTDKCPNTPKGTKVDEVGCPVVEEQVAEVVPPAPADEVIVVDHLHFAFNSDKLTSEDRSVLDGVVTRLKTEGPNAKLSITGYTDSVGSDAYNLKLSERRAVSVANYLTAAGVPQGNIVAVSGAGETQPVADNATAEGRAQNRRVTIAVDN